MAGPTSARGWARRAATCLQGVLELQQFRRWLLPFVPVAQLHEFLPAPQPQMRLLIAIAGVHGKDAIPACARTKGDFHLVIRS
jgi:hypothetical protein